MALVCAPTGEGMMPKSTQNRKLIGPYAKPKVRASGWAFQPGTLQLNPNQFIPLDTPAWFQWLELKLAFRVEQVYYLVNQSPPDPFFLSFTVRPEPRQRGQLYWYAYKKYHNRRLHPTYLGRTKDVTLYHLDQLALQFLAQINPDFYQKIFQLGQRHFSLPKYRNIRNSTDWDDPDQTHVF
jgi:hypothetical protein